MLISLLGLRGALYIHVLTILICMDLLLSHSHWTFHPSLLLLYLNGGSCVYCVGQCMAVYAMQRAMRAVQEAVCAVQAVPYSCALAVLIY